MEKEEYISQVTQVLDSSSQDIKEKFHDALGAIPEKAKSIAVCVFTDQEGEGFLDIRISLDGPDLYNLNKEIKDNADLFETKIVEGKVEPPMPLLDPFDLDFDSADTLVDTASSWLEKELKNTDLSKVNIPITILNPDGYGTLKPIKLKR